MRMLVGKAEEPHRAKRPVRRPGQPAVLLVASLFALSAMTVGARSENFEGENEMLKRLEPEELLTYFGIQYEMNQYQARQFLSLPTEEEREEWLTRFWLDLDPTPTTPENERRIEHEKRVRLARKLFGMKKAPGWDKRGETLIRFGLPSSRGRIFADVGFYRFKPPSEIWYYESLDMLVHLQDFNLSGEYIYAIKHYGRSGREEQDRYAELNDLMEYGAFQTLYASEYMDLDEMKDIVDFNPDDIGYIADPDVRMAMPKDLIAQWEQEKVERSANNFQKYMNEHPTVYSFELNKDILPFFFDISSFKSGTSKLRTDVSFEIPTSETRFIRSEGLLKAQIELRVAARNLELDQVASGVDTVNVTRYGTGETDVPSHLPGQVALDLEPGYYRIGIEVIDVNSERRGVKKTNLELESFGSGLGISDIQFASRIDEADAAQKFAKGNLRIIPHPLHAYRIPYPLTFYFEIYGLDTDNEGFSFYAVDYKITPLQKRRRGPVLEEITSIVSSKFETSGRGPQQVQRLEIATDNLWEGPFELTITVTDRRTRKSAQRSARFSVLD
jgi:GWxTD domain-containing protein